MSAYYLIRIEDNRSRVVSEMRDGVGLVDDVLVPKSKTRQGQLQYVDDFGTTTFNVLQVDEILKELAEAASLEMSTEQRQALGQLVDLARRVQDEPHRTLTFYGD